MITDSERQELIQQVLETVRTNAVTIEELLPIFEINPGDFIEVSGGRRISFKDFRSFVANLSNQDKAELEEADAELLKKIAGEIATRISADAAIEAKADTAIQLGNAANAANSRQDGEIATLQKALAGVTESLDLYALKEDGIPHFDGIVESEDDIKAGGIYFYNGKFYTRNDDEEVVLYEPYMATASQIQAGVYRWGINLYQAVYTRKPNKPGQKPAPYLLQFTELRWIDPSEILEVSMYDDEVDPFDPSKSYYFTNLASADYAAIQRRMKIAGELTVMMNLRLLDNTGEAIASLPVSVTDTSEDADGADGDYEMYGLFIYQNKLWNLYVDVCQEGSDVTVELNVVNQEATDEDVDTAADEVFGAIGTETT